jgi:uncharacterized membrane protein YcaP (DUF421 family)
MNVDWATLFRPSVPWLELVVRGSFMYLGLFVLLRLLVKRATGGVNIPDVLMVVVLADAAQNGMAGKYSSITDGMILVATIIGWNYALDWLEYHSPTMRRLLRPQTNLLYENNHFLEKNMEEETLTEDEIMSHVRQQGYASLDQVERIYIEAEGKFSVLPKKKE